MEFDHDDREELQRMVLERRIPLLPITATIGRWWWTSSHLLGLLADMI
jgi:hypothetical protein